MNKRITIVLSILIVVAISVTIFLILHTTKKSVSEDTEPIIVPTENNVVSDVPEVEYYDASGHMQSADASAIPQDSLIESGVISENNLYAKSDGEFIGQSGKFIQDTCTDEKLRKEVTARADSLLKQHGIPGPNKYYVNQVDEDMILIELINGSALFWYLPNEDIFELADDNYAVMIYTGNVTVEEDNDLYQCSYSFPLDENGYFYGYVEKERDGSFNIINTDTNESIHMTREELKTNAEYGPQYDD